ncbi:hypothetical protein EJ06DRAFT_270814 [Trichodelitschia bisporula]|uniref:Uncharacterized protein n=1 Tax=Trichodelitschia bisporula TaxID=703511 RepID=A0A6G1HHX9_9PEZI|nr:hypothetical protein EJ06DRAFT_270814 [Trichodelitschia bisporula]
MAAAPMTAASVRSPRSASAAQATSPATQPSPTGSHANAFNRPHLATSSASWLACAITAPPPPPRPTARCASGDHAGVPRRRGIHQGPSWLISSTQAGSFASPSPHCRTSKVHTAVRTLPPPSATS